MLVGSILISQSESSESGCKEQLLYKTEVSLRPPHDHSCKNTQWPNLTGSFISCLTSNMIHGTYWFSKKRPWASLILLYFTATSKHKSWWFPVVFIYLFIPKCSIVFFLGPQDTKVDREKPLYVEKYGRSNRGHGHFAVWLFVRVQCSDSFLSRRNSLYFREVVH